MDVEFIRYEFEDGHSGIITKHGLKIGVRHLQMLYMITSAVVMGFVRGSVGVAVMAMNDPARSGDTYIQIHTWDRRIQGAILSSFFFGYALMMMPAELYVRRMNGKLVFMAMLAINGALCVAMPTIANKGGWVAVCNAMLVMGTAHAGFNAVNHALIATWFTPSEKKPFSFLVYGGIQLGIIIGLPVSGMVSETRLGWELVWYTLGMAALAMAVVYGVLTASTPDKHEAIGDKEKEFISEAQKCYSKKKLHRPWRQILRSPQFWAVVGAHAASNAVFLFFLVDVPAYLRVFHLSLKDSAWFSMLPFAALWLVHLATAPVLDWLSSQRLVSCFLSLTSFRKLVNTLGAFGIVVGLTLLSNWPVEWAPSAVVMLTTTLGLLGIQFSGFLSSYKELSENHAGSAAALGCAASSALAAAAPFLAGLLLGGDMSDARRWRAVLLTLSSLYILGSALYAVLGSHRRQPWDRHGLRTRTALLHYNGILDANQVRLEEYTVAQISEKNVKQNDTAF